MGNGYFEKNSKKDYMHRAENYSSVNQFAYKIQYLKTKKQLNKSAIVFTTEVMGIDPAVEYIKIERMYSSRDILS